MPMKMEMIEGSETSAYINQTPGNYPKGNLLYSVHGESLKSGKYLEEYMVLNMKTGNWKSRTNRELEEMSKGENTVPLPFYVINILCLRRYAGTQE